MLPKGFKLPELWDVVDRCPIPQPNFDNPLVTNSSHLGMNAIQIAVSKMPPAEKERFLGAVATVETIMLMQDFAKQGKPFLVSK